MKREAGQVTRWHVVPHIGVDNVATHSWNAVQLLLELKPDASRSLIIYVLNHDVPERWMGDVPTFCKRAFGLVHKDLDAAERKLTEKLDLPHIDSLGENDRDWAEAIDALESLLWCWEQRRMGNRNLDDTMKYLDDYITNGLLVPPEVKAFYHQHQGKRTTDYPMGDPI